MSPWREAQKTPIKQMPTPCSIPKDSHGPRSLRLAALSESLACCGWGRERQANFKVGKPLIPPCERLNPVEVWSFLDGNLSAKSLGLAGCNPFLSLCFLSCATNQTRQPQQILVVHTCNLSTQEVEVGVQSQPELHNKFKASLGYRRSCLKQKPDLALC